MATDMREFLVRRVRLNPSTRVEMRKSLNIGSSTSPDWMARRAVTEVEETPEPSVSEELLIVNKGLLSVNKRGGREDRSPGQEWLNGHLLAWL
jgi:hypothetical protein